MRLPAQAGSRTLWFPLPPLGWSGSEVSKLELLTGVGQERDVGQQHALSYQPCRLRGTYGVWTGPTGQAGHQLKSPGSDGAPCVSPEANLQQLWCLRLQDLLSERTRFPLLQKERVLTHGLEERGDSLLFSLWIRRKHPSLGCTSLPVAINMEPTILILNYCPA